MKKRTNRLQIWKQRVAHGAALVIVASVSLPAPTPAQDAAAAPAAAPAAPAAAASPDAEPMIEIAMSQGRMEVFLMQFNSQSTRKLSVYGKVVEARIDVLADNEPAESILNQVANKYGWAWWREDNGDFGMADKDYYTKEVLPKRVIQKVFRPNNIKASELDKAIKGLLTQNVGSSVADDRTNKLIVNDLAPALERIERFIREIDVQLIVRVFYIRRAKVEDIAKKLEQYKSGPGSIEVDVKTRQIIVTDLLSNIKKMELLVDILDVGPEIVQYDINNVGIDGKDLEGLQKIIDSIRTTKDLLFEVNAKQGVMILEDVPEVHERVEQILAEFDKPVRQVLLQSEILSTVFKRSMSFGLKEAAWADNLLSAANQGALGSTPSILSGTSGAARSFTNTSTIFPNASFDGGAVTGNYLSSTVFLQYQAAYSDSSTRVLLQPRLLVKNQAKSTIFVGTEVPYLTTFFDNNNNNSNSTRTTSQSTVQSGLKYEVTPSISNSYLVELELKIDNDTANEVIDRSGTTAVRLVGRDRQNVESTLQIPSGQTRMLGGLIKNGDSDTNSGLPFLVSLPIVGALFGTKGQSREATNLMIFVTPTIVEDDMPRQLNSNGKRGRSLSDYERVPGSFDLNLDNEGGEGSAADDIGGKAPPAELLSGSVDEEREELMMHRQAEEDQRRAMQDEQSGNYVPSAGFGSATLNTGGGSPSRGTTTTPDTTGNTSGGRRTPPPNIAPEGGSNAPLATGNRPTETTYR
jgi:type II secretory pathway component GspD/PulD (secretin)